jgi:hypothetical protein
MSHKPSNGAAGPSGSVEDDAPTQGDERIEASGEAGSELVEAEVVDGVPVLAEVRALERTAPASLPAVQAAAAAGAGFVAGAATIALVRRRAARKAARQVRGGTRRTADLLPIVATRSFLVDVHVIAKPGE